MRRLVMSCAVAALAGGCSLSIGDASQNAETKTEAPAPEAFAGDAPSGAYTLDKSHASLIFRLDHIGFSNYTAQFMDFDAKLQLDTANLAASRVTATIDPKSLLLNAPPARFLDTLLGEKWLAAAAFPQMIFTTTKVEVTGDQTARVTGALSLKGVTKPVTLDVTLNGGYPGHPYEPRARIGFSAKGALKRTDFGISEGVPPPGSKMGVGDAVEIIIEAEFNGPPLKTPQATP